MYNFKGPRKTKIQQDIDFIRPKLSKQQFGFLKNRSCLSQLLTSFAYIFDEVDKGTSVDVVYIL